MESKIFVTELVGERILAKVLGHRSYSFNAEVGEFRVLEVSPSGSWVRLMNTTGFKFWKAITEVSYLETLKDLSAGKPES